VHAGIANATLDCNPLPKPVAKDIPKLYIWVTIGVSAVAVVVIFVYLGIK
jgi:hypothetical protein